ncbi:MAG: NUDIX domain-containing protein [Dehalococcoidia bacterium]
MAAPTQELRFCPRCADALEWRSPHYAEVLHPVCVSCGFTLWQNPKPCVDALIIRGVGLTTEVLLGRRAQGPGSGQWDTPGNFLNVGDRLEAALVRECRREMGVEVEVESLLGAYEGPFGEADSITLVYVCRLKSGVPHPAEIIDEVGWFSVAATPEIAFQPIRDAVNDLRLRLSGSHP